MRRSSGPRKTASNFFELVHQQLNMYALAASTAGVGMLALAQPAEAKVVYTKIYVVIGPKHIYHLDLNHDGIADFEIRNATFFSDFHHESLYALPARSNNGVVGQSQGGVKFAYALRRGATVGPKQPFSGTLMAASSSFGPLGPWINVSGRYLGLKFRIKGQIHYGWARLNVTLGHSFITATLTGYAYETVVNKPIIAGKTKGPDEPIVNPNDSGPGASLTSPIPDTPQPASLGMLALGAQGIPLWRRKENGSATCGFAERAQ